MDTHIDMEWKDQNKGTGCMMPGFLTQPFPPYPLSEDDTGNEGSDGRFQKHGLSVAVSLPKMKGKPLPTTSQFGKKSSSSRSLSERIQARTGFRVPKLNIPCIPSAAADTSDSGAQSPYLTIPPGLSPASLLESPVFLVNAMGQGSPTTGKLLPHGDINNSNPTRLEGPSIENGTGAFTFKCRVQEKMECLPNNQQLPSREVYAKTEATIQTAEDDNYPGHQNQRQFCRQDLMKSHRAPNATVASPPDHGQPAAAAKSDRKGEYTATATATPAAEDGYSWRKYGQKQVKHSEYPRSYFKCTHPNCPVKKKVERSHEGHVTEIIYKGMHSHPKPAQSRRPGAPFGGAKVDADDSNHPAPQQQNMEERPLWHNGVIVENWRGDGLEAAASPLVPCEVCDSAASMHVHDVAARFESPESVDVTSAVSDEVDGDDRVTHGSMFQGNGQGAADAEGDELESKRRKMESCSVEMSTASRAVREPRVVIQTTSEVDILEDGYRWRKYGQKVVKGNPNPRSYYKCTHPGCLVRKHVERAAHDIKDVITTYEGKHNHEVPAARNSGGGGGHTSLVVSQAQAGARRPEASSVQDGVVRLGSCGPPFGLLPREPMSNFPYTFGSHAAALPSLPIPAGLGGVEGLKLPTLYPFFRERQSIETTGFRVPKGDVKDEAVRSNGADGSAGYGQQVIGKLPLGHRM